MNKASPKVDGYLRKNKKWQEELAALRAIVLRSRLTEEMKWRVPCYTFEGKNVLILAAFKEWCVLSFFKGALLKDPKGILVKPGENTQAGRMIRFTNVQQVTKLRPVLKAYIDEAIEAEKAGRKVELKKITDFNVPGEFQKKLDEQPSLKTAFRALPPGRQRAYILHFGAAKQSKTRSTRVAKWLPHILKGKGMADE